ncbi:catalase family peroxidase [Actimicrobium sp. CCI2.3]|uniref:catalase family peroxidase n=1 Tax=Actimicrobium sp. CCI2.3 TaxID=3048616 RepID=UPI002AB4C622|nr:catalase family peroxidase [Actimicrobium sp. CCI2.3]MDY7576453.1 catalase family peroxidase [Actimicrobium sp. CCI2.3]MEB0021568.1 catalase family peroxidase [Actimicrobium sp. CCI2.3]
MIPTFLRLPTIRPPLLALLAGSFAFASPAQAADEKNVHEKIVDTMTVLAKGPYAGYRANHAKGIVLTGTFTPSADAPSLSKAVHFAQAVPVTVRFSNPTGIPTLPDASPNASPHGIAIRFQLPEGGLTDIVSISHNGFPVATPEDFLSFLNSVAATKPDSPKPTPVEQFLATHPAAMKFVKTPKPAPVSFATLAFYGVNAFQFTNAKGESQYARYQIIPLAGMQALTDADAVKAAPNYLMDELPQRIATGPVQFRISAQLAGKDDPINDGTKVWSDSNPQIELGILSLDKMSPDSAAAEKTLAFNPLLLTDGIVPSADPVLLSRPIAYSVSVVRRLSGK